MFLVYYITFYSDQIRRILRLPSIIAIEYKRHQDSLVDKSSYRNPTMVWRAPTKNQQNYYHDKLENGAKVGGYRNNENNRGQYNQGNNYASNNYNQNGHTEKQQQSGENNNRPGWKPRGDGDGASRPEFQKRDHQYQNQHNGGSHSGQRQDNNSWNSNNKYQNNPGWQRSGGSYQKSNQPAVTASNRLPPPTSAASVTNNQASGDVWTRVRTSSKND